MAKKQIAGVTGVLGGLISDSITVSDKRANEIAGNNASSVSRKSAPVSSSPAKVRARLGRPPRQSQDAAVVKEKLTVRIDARLAAAYRDWSWEARCQLGQLVERALEEHLVHREA